VIHDYLKAGYPAILLLTQEPHRAENALACEGWNFVSWDCPRRISSAFQNGGAAAPDHEGDTYWGSSSRAFLGASRSFRPSQISSGFCP